MSFYSKVVLDGDGTVGPFIFDKGYLNKSHVKCYLNGNSVGFSFITGSTINLDVATEIGDVLVIKRETPELDPIVDFNNGALLTEQNLDESTLQVLYVTQEAIDQLDGVLSSDIAGNFDALNRKITNLSPATQAGDAVAYEQVVGILDQIQGLADQVAQDATDAETSAQNAAQYDFQNHDHEITDVTGLQDALDDKLEEISDNSVTAAKLADNSVSSDKLDDNIRISGTFGIGDSYPVYVYRTTGSDDTSWKNIADITVNTGAYAAVSLQVEVINPHSNFGSKVDLDRHLFTVSARRSGATQDSYNDGLIAGPYADWVRLVKTATGVYQLQVRQYANNKHIEFSCKVTSLLKANVSYNKSPSNGSTTGDIYTVTETDPYHGSSIDKTRIPLKYMKFEGTNGYIHYETGFATLTRTGTGRYTCTFDAPEPDTNYEVWCDLECGTHALPFRFDARARNYTTTGFEIVVGEQNEGSWSYKDELVFVQVYRRA